MNEELIKCVLSGSLLFGLIAYTRRWRRKRYSKVCPKCGCEDVPPKTTGFQYYYRYKCPKCKYRWEVQN